MFGPEARFTYEHIRKFGYLYNGLKPEYWFWEVAWKRFDLTVNLIIATTGVSEPRSGILIYPFLAGVALCVHL